MTNKWILQKRSRGLSNLIGEEVTVEFTDRKKNPLMKGKLHREDMVFFVDNMPLYLKKIISINVSEKYIEAVSGYSEQNNELKKRDEDRYNRVNYGNRFGK